MILREGSSLCEASSSIANPVISSTLWKPELYCCCIKNPPPAAILNHIILVQDPS